MKNKKLMAIGCALVAAAFHVGLAGTTNWIIQIDRETGDETKSYHTTNRVERFNDYGRVSLYVTEAEYAAGLSVLPKRRVDEEVAKALTERATTDNWLPDDAATFKALLKRINVLETAAGIPLSTASNMMTDIKGERELAPPTREIDRGRGRGRKK